MKYTALGFLLSACLSITVRAQAPAVTIVNAGQSCSIRGMSIPDDHVIWVSGSNGHVARSTNRGKTWKWMVVDGYEKTDFRDIQAFDSNTAVIMGIGNPAYILKTNNGGQSWTLVYTKDTPGMFLDAMDFRHNKEGICIGDPIDAGDGRKTFFVIRSKDGGDTWQTESPDKRQPALDGEAVFSASGTNIALLESKDFDYAFISGGLASKLYLIGRHAKPDEVHALDIDQGKETAGAFSMATDRKEKFYCIGGDYKKPETANDNFVWTINGGQSWQNSGIASPRGYRSCVSIIYGERMVACGTNGVDMCINPRQWRRISKESFNVCMVSPNKKLIFLGGEKGRIGVLRQ